jgi:mono/diheme cytochrome c family protein
MRKALIRSVVVLVLGSAIVAQSACTQQNSHGRGGWGGMGSGHMRQGQMRGGDWGSNTMGPGQRNSTYMNKGAHPTYQNANTLARATPENVAAGARLYGEYCAGCHGKDGRGRGQSPALLNYLEPMPEAGDENLLRVISKGRRRMPAFNSALQDDEIRQIIAYMRSGFP